mmetsp:Transcript_13777/g.32850  ORF Transcript_13777/g.32850 Transcript_13777/m.32850 type:complete len:331 (-) Transcript_13777:1300-2292(-)
MLLTLSSFCNTSTIRWAARCSSQLWTRSCAQVWSSAFEHRSVEDNVFNKATWSELASTISAILSKHSPAGVPWGSCKPWATSAHTFALSLCVWTTSDNFSNSSQDAEAVPSGSCSSADAAFHTCSLARCASTSCPIWLHSCLVEESSGSCKLRATVLHASLFSFCAMSSPTTASTSWVHEKPSGSSRREVKSLHAFSLARCASTSCAILLHSCPAEKSSGSCKLRATSPRAFLPAACTSTMSRMLADSCAADASSGNFSLRAKFLQTFSTSSLLCCFCAAAKTSRIWATACKGCIAPKISCIPCIATSASCNKVACSRHVAASASASDLQ